MIWNTEEILDHWQSNIHEKEKYNATMHSNQVLVENYSLPYVTGVSIFWCLGYTVHKSTSRRPSIVSTKNMFERLGGNAAEYKYQVMQR
jgi:hypothetical protein